MHHLHQFGHHLGLAFQLIDDLLGIWGDSRVTGKPVRSDLRIRKKTFPVVVTLGSDSAAGRAFAELYRRADPLEEADLDTAAMLIEKADGRAQTQAEAYRHFELALESLQAIDPVPGPAAELAAVARLVTTRDH